MFDAYSLLHFAAGIIAYFWGVPFVWWILVHVVFEYVENTKLGMKFIERYLPLWPGGKHEKETFGNSMIGDNVSAAAGWIFASFVDKKTLSLEKRTGNTKFKKVTSA